jgi:PilZ domain-containing protein
MRPTNSKEMADIRRASKLPQFRREGSAMPRILAIEPDAARRVTLGRLVNEHLSAEVVLAASAGDALLTLVDVPPDVILTSTLLPADEDEQLNAHLRAAPDLDHLPVLTIPPVVEFANQPRPPVGLWARLFRRRRKQEPFLPYDFSAITTRIEEALEQSKKNAHESEIERPARMFLLETRASRLLNAGRGESGEMALVRIGSEPPRPEDARQWRPRSRRWTIEEVPWLSGVNLGWGANAFPTLRLLNISSTGLLVESDVRFALGKKADFQLSGSDRDELFVQGSVVRAEGSTDLKYIVAATFDRPFEALGRVRSLRELRRSGRLV